MKYEFLFPDSCLDRICGPYEQCVEDAGGVASCVCQECDGGAEDEERVCGSDGITYFSLCHLQRASCTQGQEDIEALHQGPCGTCCMCLQASISIWAPVRFVIDRTCDKTYSSFM